MSLLQIAILIGVLINVADCRGRFGDPVVPESGDEYSRCQRTHRCAQAYAEYDTLSATHVFFSTVANVTSNASRPAALFADFESWTIGTHGWKLVLNHGYAERDEESSLEERNEIHPHFDTFDFPLSGHLDTSVGDTLVFDTSNLVLDVFYGNTTNASVVNQTTAQFNATLNVTEGGIQVAVFNFLSVNIRGSVTFKGSRALSLMSRTSVIIETPLDVPPGTLGGFPGGADVGQYNLNGPGSSSAVVQLYTVHTDAAPVNAVQVVETSARAGQTLDGSFVLSFRGEELYPIAFDASARAFKGILEDVKEIGQVHVTRSARSSVGGFTWTITFVSAIGHIPLLQVERHRLAGLEADVQVHSFQEANVLGGTFTLAFGNTTTLPIPFNATSSEMRSELSKSESVLAVEVVRTDPSSDRPEARKSGVGVCDVGTCLDGPTKAMGFSWAITLVSSENNIHTISPMALDINSTVTAIPLAIAQSDLTGANASAWVETGHTLVYGSPLLYLDSIHNHTFTLALFGRGGVRGKEADLIGGSGGGIGGDQVTEILASYPPSGVGGSGGGAIEITAVNDIVLEGLGRISAEGGNGQDAFHGGGGGAGGTLSLHAQKGAVYLSSQASLSVRRGSSGISSSGVSPEPAEDGKIFLFGNGVGISHENILSDNEPEHYYATYAPVLYEIDQTRGAASTSSSLRVVFPWQDVPGKDRFSRGGPQYYILAHQQPTRVSAFVMIGNRRIGAESAWHFLLALHEHATTNDTTVAIGIGAMEGELRHGANFKGVPDNRASQFNTGEVWYKLDILINWRANVYDVRFNDVGIVLDAPMTAQKLDAIGLYVFNGAEVWFDEVFVGEDHQMGFRCPRVTAAKDQVHPEIRRLRQDWSPQREALVTELEEERSEVMRHESHLSLRELYEYENISGMVYGGGARHLQSITELPAGDRRPANSTQRFFAQGLLHTPTRLNQAARHVYDRSRTWARPDPEVTQTAQQDTQGFGSTGRYYWYVEHTSDVYDEESYGGIMACSTADMRTWRHEGVMVNFNELKYTGGVPRVRVEQTEVGVDIDLMEIVDSGRWDGEQLFGERPKVLWNNATEMYVMWMEVHDANKSIGVAVVATAESPSGPFEAMDGFLPDGNETEDQTVMPLESGGALLLRTYYARVDYILPSSVMQPIWESVKGPDGEVDFGLNFHRANYASGYDDPNDICSQRMRKEDVAFEIAMANATLVEPEEEWIKNAYTGNGQLDVFYFGEQEEPWIDSYVVGLGRPEVTSRYKHPNISVNNEWMPSSVPSVRAQPWSANYQDGNIADNVVHPTYLDKRIGPPEIILRRTAKYVAISVLTEDFRNTSGVVTFVEGGLEDSKELSSVILTLGLQASPEDLPPYNRRFFPQKCSGGPGDDEWESCNNATLQLGQSTMPGQVWGLDGPFNLITEFDWQWRYHQYRNASNDRREAPVNFKDQLVPPFVPGRGDTRSVKGREFIREYDHNCARGPNEYPEGHPLHVPADDLFNHPLSQTYTKSLDSDARIRSTREHLITQGT